MTAAWFNLAPDRAAGTGNRKALDENRKRRWQLQYRPVNLRNSRPTIRGICSDYDRIILDFLNNSGIVREMEKIMGTPSDGKTFDDVMCELCGDILLNDEIETGICVDCEQEIQRRDEKNGLYPDKWDGTN